MILSSNDLIDICFVISLMISVVIHPSIHSCVSPSLTSAEILPLSSLLHFIWQTGQEYHCYSLLHSKQKSKSAPPTWNPDSRKPAYLRLRAARDTVKRTNTAPIFCPSSTKKIKKDFPSRVDDKFPRLRKKKSSRDIYRKKRKAIYIFSPRQIVSLTIPKLSLPR